MKARDVMSQPVITIRADTPVDKAAELLVRHGFTGVPVTDDDDHLVGIVTEADLLRDRIEPDPAIRPGNMRTHDRARPTVVADVMTTSVESMTPGADASDIARVMIDERIRSIPIVDGYHIAGIVTRRDLLRASVTRSDDELAGSISRELAAMGGPDRWSITVTDGHAVIEDHVDSASDRRAAVRLAAAVPGIRGAQAHYQTCDPF